jgi:ABC-type multidrug transport system fused ATPase/permease subunit
MLELLDGSPEAKPTRMLLAPSPLDAPVRLEAVSFAYPSRPKLVLDGLDLELHPGETVALVGPSGCGKTTVANLVLGFVEPNTGRVTVGGHDLALCRPDVWRGHIAWVPQQPTMFRGTIADNIRLGRRDATGRDVRDAAVLAGADRFIQALPLAYETVVGDGGRPLSAGERRRVALARAFVRDAPLVILDEPTADLDPVNAILVGDAVTRLRQGSTVLLIGHRPELIRQADRCVLLENGRAVILPRSAVA